MGAILRRERRDQARADPDAGREVPRRHAVEGGGETALQGSQLHPQAGAGRPEDRLGSRGEDVETHRRPRVRAKRVLPGPVGLPGARPLPHGQQPGPRLRRPQPRRGLPDTLDLRAHDRGRVPADDGRLLRHLLVAAPGRRRQGGLHLRRRRRLEADEAGRRRRPPLPRGAAQEVPPREPMGRVRAAARGCRGARARPGREAGTQLQASHDAADADGGPRHHEVADAPANRAAGACAVPWLRGR
mmetsp:Transcript_31231/g.82792  ORF Transcript_31231/g.82792 Transcript_31231/m.82792 type:complete len:244 (-) Transcript_31231:705-1436(-)